MHYSPEKQNVVVSGDVKLRGKCSNCESCINLSFVGVGYKHITEYQEEEDEITVRKKNYVSGEEAILGEKTTREEYNP